MPSLLSDAQLTQIRERLKQGAIVSRKEDAESLLALVDQLRQERDEAAERAEAAWRAQTDETCVGWHRDMAARITEDRDIQKHRARNAEASCSRLRRVLEEIRDWSDCQCEHDDDNCCANTVEGAGNYYNCPGCIAAKALSVRDDGPQTAEQTEETDKA